MNRLQTGIDSLSDRRHSRNTRALGKTISRRNPIREYFQCIPEVPDFQASAELHGSTGFFRFGSNAVCYGTSHRSSRVVHNKLFDAARDVRPVNGSIELPFDAGQVIDNLRYERYVQTGSRWLEKSWVKSAYYRLRPMLPVSFRKHLQRIYLRDWDSIQFPIWPVDRSADQLVEQLLVLAMQQMRTDTLPFIWFWPEGHKAGVIVTHDVETRVGRDFSEQLMDIDDAYGIKASFQLVPEKRYELSPQYLEEIRARGFEINVQGLDHDGNLFEDRDSFLAAAERINQYALEFRAVGFRSPSLFRNIEWFQDLRFSYDMSVPNVARLEAQRGGCCTVMPYFLPGGMVELPLTTTEDYTLFNILKDHSIALWKQQMSLIMQQHGLISFIVHPDYVTSDPAQGVYKELLKEIARLHADHDVWVTLPQDVDRWWRERSEMKLVRAGKDWRIQGRGSERARIAYAHLEGDRLRYEVDSRASATALA